MQHLPGLAPLAPRYDGLILDLWGVVHDGIAPFAGVIDCLERLRAAGKRIVFLSNAPRRADPTVAQLRAMGIPDGLHDGVVTSGEAVHLALRDRAAPGADPWYAGLGRRVFHLGPMRDRNVLIGLDLIVKEEPEGADFVLNTGPDDHRSPTSVAPFENTLRACRAASLPMICANPDLEVIRGGVRVICAGALARRYEEMGGSVRSLGKPDPAIYGPVLALLGTARARTLAVGDALRTDIAGAAAAGVDACWVLGGIHAEGLVASDEAPESLARAADLSPVAIVPGFVWGA